MRQPLGSDHDSIGIGKEFQLPVWLITLTLLLLELSLYGWFIRVLWLRNWPYPGLLGVAIALPLLLRLLIAFVAYRVSRWKGIVVPNELNLRLIAWFRFFAVEYAHFCLQTMVLIPFRVLFHTATERGKIVSSGPVVLLQHGYGHNGGVWFFTARALERKGFRVFTIDQPGFASIDHMGDLLAARIDAVLCQTGEPRLILIAHSMGGLVCRAFLRRHGGAKIARLITLGTPHYGTFHARFANGMNGMQMRIGNDWLKSLADSQVDVPFTSIYSVHDTVIAPQDSSVVIGAENIRLSGVGHVSMPSGKLTRNVLLQLLEPSREAL